MQITWKISVIQFVLRERRKTPHNRRFIVDPDFSRRRTSGAVHGHPVNAQVPGHAERTGRKYPTGPVYQAMNPRAATGWRTGTLGYSGLAPLHPAPNPATTRGWYYPAPVDGVRR